MFKLIEYLNSTYNGKTDKYTYHYHLVDTDFECDISAASAEVPTSAGARAEAPTSVGAAAAAAAEYHKRNLDVVRNIYLLNMYLQKEKYPNWTFMDILVWQNEYIDNYYPIPGLNFSQDIYPKVKELYEKINPFK